MYDFPSTFVASILVLIAVTCSVVGPAQRIAAFGHLSVNEPTQRRVYDADYRENEQISDDTFIQCAHAALDPTHDGRDKERNAGEMASLMLR